MYTYKWCGVSTHSIFTWCICFSSLFFSCGPLYLLIGKCLVQPYVFILNVDRVSSQQWMEFMVHYIPIDGMSNFSRYSWSEHVCVHTQIHWQAKKSPFFYLLYTPDRFDGKRASRNKNKLREQKRARNKKKYKNKTIWALTLFRLLVSMC